MDTASAVLSIRVWGFRFNIFPFVHFVQIAHCFVTIGKRPATVGVAQVAVALYQPEGRTFPAYAGSVLANLRLDLRLSLHETAATTSDVTKQRGLLPTG